MAQFVEKNPNSLFSRLKYIRAIERSERVCVKLVRNYFAYAQNECETSKKKIQQRENREA